MLLLDLVCLLLKILKFFVLVENFEWGVPVFDLVLLVEDIRVYYDVVVLIYYGITQWIYVEVVLLLAVYA